MVPYSKAHSKGKVYKNRQNALLTEELLEKIMLAKTKHKKLWEFY
jgi:hypothetical protein